MDTFQKILLVVNPISGNLDKNPFLEKIENRLPKGSQLEVYETSGKNDKEQISGIVREKKTDRILIAGGDGTIKLVAESVENPDIVLGILPMGSANGLASDLDLPPDPEKCIPIALGESTQKIDALCINNRLSLHISDFGLNAELIKRYEESTFRGKFGYAINSISTLYNSEMPYEFTIEANGKTIRKEAIMLALANSSKYGTGALVNPLGKMDDGKFEILVFKKFDILEIINALRGELRMSSDFIEVIQTDKAKISTPFPIDFQMDGEYCNALTQVEAEIIHHKLHVAV